MKQIDWCNLESKKVANKKRQAKLAAMRKANGLRRVAIWLSDSELKDILRYGDNQQQALKAVILKGLTNS